MILEEDGWTLKTAAQEKTVSRYIISGHEVSALNLPDITSQFKVHR